MKSVTGRVVYGEEGDICIASESIIQKAGVS